MRALRTLFPWAVCLLLASSSASGQFLHGRHGGIHGGGVHGGGHVIWPHAPHHGFGPLVYQTDGYGHLSDHGHSHFELSWYTPPSSIVFPPWRAPWWDFNRFPDPGRGIGAAGLVEEPARANQGPLDAAAPRPHLFQPRTSNKTARRRAAKYIAYGDALFSRQKEHSALQRYKTAAKAAPDLAEIHFRQGLALVATHRYDLAAAAFKRGLILAPAGADAGDVVSLDALYQDNLLAKESHLEALAQAVALKNHNADYWFVLGMFLRHDGQAERARKFFQQAQQLSGGAAAHLNGLLEKKKAAKAGIDA